MNAGHPDAAPPCDGRAAAKPPRRWTPQRIAFSCCKLTAGLVVLAIVALGLLVARMQQGPIPLEGLGQKIASSLHERFGGVQFALGATALVQRGFGPTLTIDSLAVTGRDGTPILTAPKAEVFVDPFALMFGKVVPRRLDVFDVTLRLVLLRNGNLAVAAGQGKPFFEFGRGGDGGGEQATSPQAASVTSGQEAPAIPPQGGGGPPVTPTDPAATVPSRRAAVMKQASAAIRRFMDVLTDPRSAIAAVDRLGIARGTLVIEDQVTGEATVYKGLDLAFDRAHGVTNLVLSAEGPSGRWRVSALADGTPGAERHFGLAADNLSVDELQLLAGTRSIGAETDMPVAFRFDMGLKPDDSLSRAVGTFKLGPGFLRLDDPDYEPVFGTTIAGGFHWNGDDRQIIVDATRYSAGSTHFTIAGQVMPPLNEGEPWRIGLATTEPGVFGPDRKGQLPVPMEGAQFAGRLLLGEKKLMLDRLAMKVGGGGMALAGQVDWLDGPHIRFGASMDATPVPVVQRMWPAFMASPVRAWILTHFDGGTVTEGRVQVDYDGNALQRMRADRSPPDASVSLDVTVSKSRVTFLEGVPPIENVEAVAHVTGRTSRLDVSSGTIVANGKPIALTEGVFAVDDADHHPVLASVDAHLAGSVEAVTDLLSRPALKPYAALPLDSSTLHGQIEGHLTKTISLGAVPDVSQETLRVDAKVKNFVADHLIGKENLEDGTLAISVDSATGLKATGQGRIFGGPATFELTRAGTAPLGAVIAVTLDDAARARVGLSAIPGVTGPIAAHINASLGDASKIKAQVDVDLTKTAIAAAFLGLDKPAGKPAKIAFNLATGDDRTAIDALVVDVGSLQARGAVDLGANYALQSARFPSFKVSPGDDMKLDVGMADNVFKLTIRGSTIDARPYLKALTTTPGNESTPLSRSAKAEKKEADSFKGFDIDLKSGLLTGFNKETMSNVDLILSKRDGQIRQFSVQGRFGRQLVSGAMGGNQLVRISAQDAGALVSFVDLYKHMEGGSLRAAMRMGGDQIDGNLEIQDFTLRDEPALRRLVAQSTEVSAPGQDADAARRINGSAAAFKRLKVEFHRAGSRLELKDATMYGPEIGLSVDGWLDYSHDQVAMNGTFVPVFAINNLFAQIPVFGIFLGGRSNEGLLAITFRIAGLASSPTLSINPLSAIAPGFLRNIFGALDNANVPRPATAGASNAPLR